MISYSVFHEKTQKKMTKTIEDLMYDFGDIFHVHAGDDKLLDKDELKRMMSKGLFMV